VCFIALCLNLFLKPYKVQADNQFAGIVLFQLFLTLFLGFLREHVPADLDEWWITFLVLSSNGLVICLAGYFIGAGGIKAGMHQKLQLEVDRSKMVNRLVAMKWKEAYRTIVVLRAASKITEAATQLHSADSGTDKSTAAAATAAAPVGKGAGLILTFSEIAERRKRVAGIMAVQRRVMTTKATREVEDIKNIKIPTTKQKGTLLLSLKKLLGLKKEKEHGDSSDEAGANGQSADPRMRAAVAGGAVAGVAVVGAAAVVASGNGPVSFGDIGGAFDHAHDGADDDDDSDDGSGFEMEGGGGDFDHGGGHDVF
jgi:hypothetical protein